MEGISIGTKENIYSSSYLIVWKSTDSLIMSEIQWGIKERNHFIEWIHNKEKHLHGIKCSWFPVKYICNTTLDQLPVEVAQKQ